MAKQPKSLKLYKEIIKKSGKFELAVEWIKENGDKAFEQQFNVLVIEIKSYVKMAKAPVEYNETKNAFAASIGKVRMDLEMQPNFYVKATFSHEKEENLTNMIYSTAFRLIIIAIEEFEWEGFKNRNPYTTSELADILLTFLFAFWDDKELSARITDPFNFEFNI
jgi:hypothetical protein